MKDLYARARLRPYESDEAQLHAAMTGSTADIEAARYVLLHEGRRRVYDRTHATLSDIGLVRAALMLDDGPHWRGMADFTPKSAREKPATTPAGGRRWGVLAIGVVLAVMLFWLAQTPDRPMDTKGLTIISSRDIRHVTADTLNVRAEPSAAGQILFQLHKYDTVGVDMQAAAGDWAPITYQGASGFVAAAYLAAGDGRTAEDADCLQAGTARPYSGEILERSDARGKHVLTVRASASSDAMVKLKTPSGATVLSTYIRAGETASVDTIPDGRYRFQFATGTSYSPSCRRFTVGMQAFADDELKAFTTQYEANQYYLTTLEYTLYDVISGNFQPTAIDSRSF